VGEGKGGGVGAAGRETWGDWQWGVTGFGGMVGGRDGEVGGGVGGGWGVVGVGGGMGWLAGARERGQAIGSYSWRSKGGGRGRVMHFYEDGGALGTAKWAVASKFMVKRASAPGWGFPTQAEVSRGPRVGRLRGVGRGSM